MKVSIDDIKYIISIKSNENDHHELYIFDETNKKEYISTGTSVINFRVFESKPISKFDSSRGSLFRTNNIELSII